MEDSPCACCQRCPPRTARGSSRLLLASTAAQWLVILGCLVCIGVRYHHEGPGTQEVKDGPLFTETEVPNGPELKPGQPIPLIWRFGKRNVQNNSLVISKDGYYLLCLHGNLENRGDKANLTVYHKSHGGEAKPVLQGQMTNHKLNLLTLQRLLKDDRIYAEVKEASSANLSGISLFLKLVFLSESSLD